MDRTIAKAGVHAPWVSATHRMAIGVDCNRSSCSKGQRANLGNREIRMLRCNEADYPLCKPVSDMTSNWSQPNQENCKVSGIRLDSQEFRESPLI
jgi:hypothetical protein